PLRLRDTYLPVNFPFLVWPHASDYSLDLDEQLNPVDGPLLDFTVYNPSLAWGTNLVSDMDDLARFYRALMGGRLLRSAQLAEMKTTVEGRARVPLGTGARGGRLRLRPHVGAFRRRPGVRQRALQQRGRHAPVRPDDQRRRRACRRVRDHRRSR
ncbi:MAG TPA: hypothetical protein VFY45_18815, partial [Baekduia sp.]|nr:hypothetical protein [Baekduia sp.]